jgi:hypothetical protein
VVATAASHAVSVAVGKSGEIKTTVKRLNGFKSKLLLAAKNLPEGVSAPEVEVPEKGGEVSLKIIAMDSAPAASQPLQLVLHAPDSAME